MSELDALLEFEKADAPKLFEKATLAALAELYIDDRGRYEHIGSVLRAKGVPGIWKVDQAIVQLVRAIEAERQITVDANGFALDAKNRIRLSQANIRRAVELLGVQLRYEGIGFVADFGDGFPYQGKRGSRRLWLAIDEKFGFRPPLDFFKAVIKDAANPHPGSIVR